MSGTDEQGGLRAEGASGAYPFNASNQANLNSLAGSDNTADQIAALKAEDLRKEAASYRTLTCI